MGYLRAHLIVFIFTLISDQSGPNIGLSCYCLNGMKQLLLKSCLLQLKKTPHVVLPEKRDCFAFSLAREYSQLLAFPLATWDCLEKKTKVQGNKWFIRQLTKDTQKMRGERQKKKVLPVLRWSSIYCLSEDIP